jgi:ADP-ribosyl-[dinitrogen reductase] hydrolase
MMADLPHADMISFAHDQSMVTHAHPRSLIACGIYSDFVWRIIQSDAAEIDALWNETRAWAKAFYEPIHRGELSHFDRVLKFNAEAWRSTHEREINSSGYVIHTLEAALWGLFTTTSWKSCALAAVNLGSDTDTTGAVAGGLAGLVYGDEALPADWVSQLARLAEIEELIEAAASTQ